MTVRQRCRRGARVYVSFIVGVGAVLGVVHVPVVAGSHVVAQFVPEGKIARGAIPIHQRESIRLEGVRDGRHQPRQAAEIAVGHEQDNLIGFVGVPRGVDIVHVPSEVLVNRSSVVFQSKLASS